VRGQDGGCTAVAVIHTFAARSLRAHRSHSGLRPETRSPARHRAHLVQLTHRQGHELAHLVELRPGTGAAPVRARPPAGADAPAKCRERHQQQGPGLEVATDTAPGTPCGAGAMPWHRQGSGHRPGIGRTWWSCAPAKCRARHHQQGPGLELATSPVPGAPGAADAPARARPPAGADAPARRRTRHQQ
jgi:hypothetical protein